jgi:hypothetical protein
MKSHMIRLPVAVTAVTENVVAAEIAAVADALPATGTEAHIREMRPDG